MDPLARPSLDSLQIFANVVEARGFSSAARKLNVPVSTVSRRIKELEISLGVTLIERSTRSFRLTEIGAEIFAHARITLDVSDAVMESLSARQTNVVGTVSVAAPPSISDTLLAPLVCAFQERHPGIRVRALIVGRWVNLAAEGIDVAFTVGRVRDDDVVVRHLLKYRHQLVASPKYVRRFGQPSHPDQLAKHRVLRFEFWNDELAWTFINAGSGEVQTPKLRPSFSINDYAGLLAAIRGGSGISDLPPIVQPKLLRDGELVEVMGEWRFRPLDFCATHVKGRTLLRPVKMFLEFTEAFLPKLFPQLPA